MFSTFFHLDTMGYTFFWTEQSIIQEPGFQKHTGKYSMLAQVQYFCLTTLYSQKSL